MSLIHLKLMQRNVNNVIRKLKVLSENDSFLNESRYLNLKFKSMLQETEELKLYLERMVQTYKILNINTEYLFIDPKGSIK